LNAIMVSGGQVGRKIGRVFGKVGRKFVRDRGMIGRKLGKIGKGLSGFAPFLAAVPGIGPELAVGAAALGAGSQAAGRGIAARGSGGVKRAGGDLAQTYGAYKAARGS
jgi:hypothetical protein